MNSDNLAVLFGLVIGGFAGMSVALIFVWRIWKILLTADFVSARKCRMLIVGLLLEKEQIVSDQDQPDPPTA
jgi:hypothetical protein